MGIEQARYCKIIHKEAYTLPDQAGVSWEHTQSETDGGTGLAMHIAAENLSCQERSRTQNQKRVVILRDFLYTVLGKRDKQNA